MNRLKDKMANYQVVPPAQVWEKIAASLDESESGKAFPAVLYNLEVNPPPAAWHTISSSLEDESATPVIVFKKRTIPFLRYAVAAALIGIVAFAVFKFTDRTASTDPIDKATVAAAKKEPNTITNDLPVPSQDEKVEQPLASVEDNNELTRVTQPIKTHKASRNVSTASYNYDYTSDAATNPLYAYQDHAMPNLADRYIMLMTPEGNIIRMSKKWGNLVCCVSGEEQDADCKSQLKKWQEKLAASAAAPSSGNFLDILDLVSSLDEGDNDL